MARRPETDERRAGYGRHGARLPRAVARKPTRQKAADATAPSFLQRARGLKLADAKRAASGPQHGTDAYEGADPAASGDAGLAHEKLAYDELLRYTRSRAEDTEKLLAAQRGGESAGGEQDRERFRQACGFREEWRREKEDAVLQRLGKDDEGRAEPSDATELEDVKMNALRTHLKCSAHVFLSANTKPPAGPGQPTKRLQDFLYAQQMDRILREIDEQHPYVAIREAIADARSRFRSLMATGVVSNNAPRSGPTSGGATPSESVKTDRAADVLQLYENVVAAKASAVQPTKSRTASTPASMGTMVAVKPAPVFLALLQQQRDEAEQKDNEVAAQSHFRQLCARRIRCAYVKWRERRDRERKMASLRARIHDRAARVLQVRLLVACRQYRRVSDAKAELLRRCQGKTIATCCFWRCIYWKRCGFAVFRFQRQVSARLIRAVIRIQCWIRRFHALRRAAHLRAVRQIQQRKAMARKWELQQARKKAVAELDAELAEWVHHIGIERARVRAELAKEEERFDVEWDKYESKLRSDVMKSKLPAEWIPQMDQVSGEQYFLNIKTARVVKEHPNALLFKQLIAKQRVRAEELLQADQSRLVAYLMHLDSRLHERSQQILAEMDRRMLQFSDSG